MPPPERKFVLRREGPRFDIENERDTFDEWKDSWNSFVIVSGLSDIEDDAYKKEMKYHALIDACSRETIKTIRNLNLPAADKDDSDKVIKALDIFIKGGINDVVWRLRYMNRHQQEGESFDDWLISLREIARKCNFGKCCDRCENLRLLDQIVLGVRDPDIRQKLLAKGADLTLEIASDICQSEEHAYRDRTECSQDVMISKLSKSTYKKQKAQFTSKNNGDVKKGKCKFCNYEHEFKKGKCPATGKKCRSCDKTGHFESCCTKKDKGEKSKSYVGSLVISSLAKDLSMVEVDFMDVDKPQVKGKLKVLPDTGANVDAIPVDKLNLFQTKMKCLKSPGGDSNPETADGSRLKSVGILNIEFGLGKAKHRTKVHVLKGLKCPILSRKSLQKLKLIPDNFPYEQVNTVQTKQEDGVRAARKSSSVTPAEDLDELKKKFPKIFDGQVRVMKGETCRITLKEDAVPFSVSTARHVAEPLMPKVKDELDTLERSDVIVKVTEPTPWCHPIVVAPKKDPNKIRLCVDFRKLNQHVVRPRYMTRTPAQVVRRIPEGAKYFTVVDALKGYHQVLLDEESQKLTTFITPFGRYMFKRLPFGVSDASEEYNMRFDTALEGLENSDHIVEDVLVYDTDYKEHIRHVSELFKRCDENGISLNTDKITFAAQEVTFGGFRLSKDGYTIDPGLVKAVREFPVPVNKTDMKSFMGLVNQIGGFTEKIAELGNPLRDLMSKKNAWLWTETHQQAFDTMREELSKVPVLVYYDPEKPTAIHTDASRLKGLGFVLKQKQTDGQWKMIQAGSRFLSDAETRYAMIELELLAIVWAVKKCRLFLEGLQDFKIVTDHKPLLPILNSYTLDKIENPRLQRLRQKLDRYNYTATWVAGKFHEDADALSRNPVDDAVEDDLEAEFDDHQASVNMAIMSLSDENSNEDVRLTEIKEEGEKDIEYTELKTMIENGFPNEKANMPNNLRPYWAMREQLAVDDDLIVCGCRLVIP